MSEPKQKSGGGALAGATSALALSAVGFVAVSVLVPVDLPDAPTIPDAPQSVSVDPPEVLDNTDQLLAPGAQPVPETAEMDREPALPVADRDTPVNLADQADTNVEPMTDTGSVTTPQVDVASPSVPEDTAQAPAASGLPNLAPTADVLASQAPDPMTGAGLSLASPETEFGPVEVPQPATSAAVATIQTSEPIGLDGSGPSPAAPDVDTLASETVAAIAAPKPSVEDVETLATATPEPTPVTAPLVNSPVKVSEAAPETPPDTRVASIAVPPTADNPVTRKPEPSVADATEAAPDADAPAFTANADQTFVPDPNKPYLAIVIEDLGVNGVPAKSLTDLAIPVTIGVKTGNKNVAQYRARGLEVTAQVTDTDGAKFAANASEANVLAAISALREEFGRTVAISEPADGDLYRNAKLMSVMGRALAETGHGALVFERFGAGTAVAAIRAEGVPTGSILRVLDETRDAAAIRRALDRAALEASKTGAAIVYARSYPETLAALLPWLLSNTARSIQIAPLTATITRAEAG